MTENKDFKQVVRKRAAKTGESYSTAGSNLIERNSDDGLTLARDQIASTLHYFWGQFRPTLRGLTDDEYLWEPVPGCPTIRPGEDGEYRCDNQFPVQGAASIAQRLCWAAQLTLVDINQHFGDKSVTWKEVAAVPAKAADGVALLDSAVTKWHAAIAGCDPSFFSQHSENKSPGAIDGQFPFIGVVLFKFQLLVECCSQVSATRDLYLHAHPDIVSPR